MFSDEPDKGKVTPITQSRGKKVAANKRTTKKTAAKKSADKNKPADLPAGVISNLAHGYETAGKIHCGKAVKNLVKLVEELPCEYRKLSAARQKELIGDIESQMVAMTIDIVRGVQQMEATFVAGELTGCSITKSIKATIALDPEDKRLQNLYKHVGTPVTISYGKDASAMIDLDEVPEPQKDQPDLPDL